MLTIEVELLHGTIRSSTQDTALTGDEDPGEWPPSPARLFSALVAADGTRDRCQVTDGSELRFLETQLPPMIHADPSDQVLGSPVNERFIVLNRTAENTVQDYPGRTNSVARPGSRQSPRNPHVAYVWSGAEPDSETLGALALRAARVGYLGCADSPVRVQVSDRPPSYRAPQAIWEPVAEDGNAAEATMLPVPYNGLVDVLDAAYDQFTNEGTVRRSWYRTDLVSYRDPSLPDATHRVPGIFIWLHLDTPIPGRRVLAVTDTLRRAVFDIYQREVLGDDGDLPSVLTGHGFTGRGYQHAHWLALPDVGHAYSRGRIHGAAIWLPEDTPGDVVAGVHTAVWRLRRLVKPDVFDVEIRPHAGERRPWAAHPRRWQKPSKRFASVFPVVHERFVRPEPSLEDISAWCDHAGLPSPIEFRQHREPRLPGAVALHPREAFRPDDERRPYSHLELTFDRPVVGPVVLGRKRQFGLGLFAPLDGEGADD